MPCSEKRWCKTRFNQVLRSSLQTTKKKYQIRARPSRMKSFAARSTGPKQKTRLSSTLRWPKKWSDKNSRWISGPLPTALSPNLQCQQAIIQSPPLTKTVSVTELIRFSDRRNSLSVNSRGNRASKAHLQRTNPLSMTHRWTSWTWLRSPLWPKLQSYHNLDKIRLRRRPTHLKTRVRSRRLWRLLVGASSISSLNAKARKVRHRQRQHKHYQHSHSPRYRHSSLRSWK